MKNPIKKATSLMLAMLLLLTGLTPAFAESGEHYDTVTGHPRLADVKDQLNAGEIVKPTEITIHKDDDFDPEDTSRMTGFDHASVRIKLYKNALSAGFKARTPGSYTLYYVVQPTSGHPAYEASWKIHIVESTAASNAEGGTDDSAAEQTPEKADEDTEDDPHENDTEEARPKEGLDEGQPDGREMDASGLPASEAGVTDSPDTPPEDAAEEGSSESAGQTEQPLTDKDGESNQSEENPEPIDAPSDDPASEDSESTEDPASGDTDEGTDNPEETDNPSEGDDQSEETVPEIEEPVEYAVEIVEDIKTGGIVMSAAPVEAEEPALMTMTAASYATGYQSMEVVLDRGTQIDYPSDLGSWATTGYRVDGKVAYCLEAKKDGPKKGTYYAEVLASNPNLAKALYYGYGGPGDLSGQFYPEYDEDVRYIMTHIAASYFYTGDYEDATAGCRTSGQEKYRILEYINYLETLPDPPSPSIRLTDDALTVKTVEGGTQVTTSTTLDADYRNGITLTLPANVTYHNQDTGAEQTGGTVYIAGGTTFYFSAPSSESGVWLTEQLNGLIDHVWQVIVFSTGEKTQDIGSYIADYYGDSVHFSVSWTNELRLTLVKADADNPDVQLSGAVIGVYSDEACTNQIATMTTGEDGSAGCALTRDYERIYLKELTAPAGYRLNTTVYTVDIPDGDSVTAMIKDEKQQAGLKITKKGEALTGANATDNGLSFLYEARRLSGAVYRVKANGSIYNADGSLLYQKGDIVVENLITDEEGEVFIGGLPLGSYLVEETQAPQGYLLSTEAHTVTLDYAGQEAETAFDETTFVNERQKASVTVVKQDRDSAILLSGAVFGLYNDSAIYSVSGDLLAAADTLIERVTTGADGTAVFSADLPIGHGYTVRELEAPAGYTADSDAYSFSFNGGDQTPVVAFSHTFADDKLMARFQLVKVDAETGTPQGNAKLSGAVYGLYARETIAHPDGSTGALYEKDALVLTMTTDADGKASAENLYPGRYYVKEITPSEGYTLDTAEYEVDFTQSGTDAQPEVICTVKEQVMKQPFQIIKAANNGKTNADLIKGAGFSAWPLSDVSGNNGVYDPSGAQPVALGANGETEIFTDQHGHAQSVPLPYGSYLVRETTTPENYSPVDDFIVTISENLPETPQVWRVLLDEEFAARLKIVKIDADTGRTILVPGAEFAVYDLERQEYVTQLTAYPQQARLSTFKTDASGTLVMPEKLRPGRYRVEEVTAPEGYLLSGETAEVTISAAGLSQTDPLTADAVFTVTLKNKSAKGRITVYKEGEMLTGYENGQFAYTTQRLSGASFDVIAAEDIYTADHQTDEGGNRYLEYAEGTVIASLTTDASGEAQTGELPLGQYAIVEKETPDGFVIDFEPHPVALNYAGQETAVVMTSATILNDRQKVAVTVEKKVEGKSVRLPGAVFALYAGEDISAQGQLLVPAGTCIATVETDESGTATFDIDLPLGKYALGEIQAPAGYVRSEEARAVDASYHGPLAAKYTLHYTFENAPVRVAISKADATTSVELNGAQLSLLDADGTVLDTWTSVAGEPHIMEGLTIGQTYTLREEIAPYGYLMTNSIQFTVQDTEQVQKAVMKDDAPTGTLIINKSGEFLGSVSTLESVGGAINSSFSYLFGGLGDVSFNVYAKDNIKHADGATRDHYKAGDLVATITTDATGVATLENLPLGRYVVREVETPNGYVLDGKERVIDLTYRDAVTPVITYSESWQNERQHIALRITKQDVVTGDMLGSAVFGLYTGEHIFAQDGSLMLLPDTQIAQQATDSNGELSFDIDLPVGYAYYVKELTPPGGYATNPDIKRFTFDGSEQGATVSFEYAFTDQPTLIDVTKRSLTTGEEVVGAMLQVTDDKGAVIDKWMSEEEPHRITGLVVGKSYMLMEILPAEGYVTAESVTFTVEDTGEIQTVEMKDDVTKVKISKVDIAGDKLEGATLILLNEEGREIDRWVSEKEPHYIEMLPIGHYTLREESAPDGYLVAEEITFEVTDTGEIQTVVMKDEHTRLRISKADIAGNELEGASLTLLDDAGNVVESWISGKEPHYIEHLPAGIYTLREESAPEGYLIADEITFELKAIGVVQTLTMVDEAKPGTPTTPKTGDDEQPMLWISVGAVALLGIALSALTMKKRRPRR